MLGVPPIVIIPWSLYLLNYLEVQTIKYLHYYVWVSLAKNGWETRTVLESIFAHFWSFQNKRLVALGGLRKVKYKGR